MAKIDFASKDLKDRIEALENIMLIKENIDIQSNSHSDADFNIEHSGWTINGNYLCKFG